MIRPAASDHPRVRWTEHRPADYRRHGGPGSPVPLRVTSRSRQTLGERTAAKSSRPRRRRYAGTAGSGSGSYSRPAILRRRGFYRHEGREDPATLSAALVQVARVAIVRAGWAGSRRCSARSVPPIIPARDSGLASNDRGGTVPNSFHGTHPGRPRGHNPRRAHLFDGRRAVLLQQLHRLEHRPVVVQRSS